ncbi:unnamed protein product, partial [Musa acuminata subsp. burmannicoides]
HWDTDHEKQNISKKPSDTTAEYTGNRSSRTSLMNHAWEKPFDAWDHPLAISAR